MDSTERITDRRCKLLIASKRKCMTLIEQAVARIAQPERRRDQRVPARDLIASYWTGLEQKRVQIRNISPTGVYLLTDDRWFPGTSFQLMLQESDPGGQGCESEVRLQTQVVRSDADGVGVVFVSDHVDTAGWINLFSRAAALTRENGAVRVFRMAKALAFLLRISPLTVEETLQLLSGIQTYERTEEALGVVLMAEELTMNKKHALRKGVSPHLISRVLDEGSRAREHQKQRGWAGLLAASCTPGASDEEILRFANLLSRLDLLQLRIITMGGQKTAQNRQQAEATSPSFEWQADEIKSAVDGVGSGGEAPIEGALSGLCELGLVESSPGASASTPVNGRNLSLTDLGLEFYARYCGETQCWVSRAE